MNKDIRAEVAELMGEGQYRDEILNIPGLISGATLEMGAHSAPTTGWVPAILTLDH